MEKNMDSIYTMAKFTVDTPYDAISPAAISVAKTLFLDILATVTAGSTAPTCQEVFDLYKDWGGKEECNVLVFNKKLPAPHAVYINALLAHARDFDDTLDNAVIHTGVSVIPTCIAAAEAKGHVSGKEFLKAVVMSVDMFARLSLASKWSVFQSGFTFSSLLGYFACSFAAGLIKGFTPEQIVNTAGIVISQAGGTHLAVTDSALSKRMQPAFAAMAATHASYLTAIGVTGCKNVLDGPQGLYANYMRGNYNKEVLTKDLGKSYYIEQLSYKPYPCCRYTHSAIDDARKLVKEHNIKPEEITSIDISTSKQVYNGVCLPLDTRRQPKAVVEAQFSIPFTMASAIVNGTVDLDSFTDANFHNEKILALTAKINPSVNEEIESKYGHGCSPSKVTIHTTKGDFTECVIYPLGSPENPMTLKDILIKLEGAKAYSAKKVKDGAFEKIVDMVEHLEELPDVNTLFAAIKDAYEA